MTATQLPLSLAQRHNNQQLFSDHDLNVTLPQRPEVFLYFYAFFHRTAFAPGPLSLDALLKESAAYARGVGDSLKGQVTTRSKSWRRASSTTLATAWSPTRRPSSRSTITA